MPRLPEKVSRLFYADKDVDALMNSKYAFSNKLLGRELEEPEVSKPR